MTYPVQRRCQRRRDLAVVRFEASVDEVALEVGAALDTVRRGLGRRGLPVHSPAFVIFRPGPGVFRVAAGYAVDAPIAAEGGVVPDELPECEAAAVVHNGPFDEIYRAYEALHTGITAMGRTSQDLIWEEYHMEPDRPDGPGRIAIVWPLVPEDPSTG